MDTYFLSVIKTIGIQGKISSSFHLGLSRGRLFRPVYKEVDFNPFSARSLIDCFYVSATKADKFTLNSVINTQLSEFDRLSLLFRNQNQQPLKARNSRLSSPFHDLSQHPFKTGFSIPRSIGAVSRSVSHTFLNIPLVEGYEFNPSSCQILIGGLFVSAINCGLFKASLSQFLLHIIGSTTVHRFAQVFSIPTSALLVPQSNRLNFGFRDQVRRLLQTAPLIWQSTLV
ncbi:hypothetical protein PGT21_036931 [Puccinia graminis f. sp. tritici]|uniref:Uncharacterized protein n=1 Tax=Puccinia graminis f. sp. tritici TaxID=56615 RepID=A0A5B0PUU6_PUCGR|nr:hypothetical protein PGT21_000383 [Puccinia graminis f. sp. tritici]KAA1106668.1 hypothetical protein PGT21_036931 [Puccinia graminis f. sp. tritici]